MASEKPSTSENIHQPLLSSSKYHRTLKQRNTLICILVWAVVLATVCVVISVFTTRPFYSSRMCNSGLKNILFIIVDDLRPTLGCYGDRSMITPNIDQLARRGIKFNWVFAQQAECGPSRTSLLTSRRPDTTFTYDQHTCWRTSAGNFRTLPQHFKKSGYYTVSVGKVFHPGKASNMTDDYPYSWSQEPYHPSTQQYKMAKVCPGPDGKLHMNLICPVKVDSQPEGTLPDIQSSQYARDFLKHFATISELEKCAKPFFLAVGFHKPHIPLKFPQEYINLYPLSSMSLAPDPRLPHYMPPVAWNPWMDLRKRDDVKKFNVSFPYGELPEKFQKEIRQGYFASISYMDDLVGQLLGTLEQTGLASNTLVVFLGDHGWSLGEHQEWSKFSNFEVALQVPLLISIPHITDLKDGFRQPFRYVPVVNNTFKKENSFHVAIKESYREVNELVELVDLYPTLVELSEIPLVPPCSLTSNEIEFCTEGSSLKPLIDKAVYVTTFLENSISWKNAVFSQYPRPSLQPMKISDSPELNNIHIMGYTMRTNKYRYTEWMDFDPKTLRANWSSVHAQELYLHEDDPLEDRNKAGFNEYKELVDNLSKQLREGWRAVLPKAQ
ncbi:iduronate 2-sulfatase isoform X2 [Tachypleus tridentatus]|uniref:iduronate 2-sulfatase isoform X2 n=1 Tax=Tachypleus tridentatus TaxID=6853 RepID=UPI003FD5A87A